MTKRLISALILIPPLTLLIFYGPSYTLSIMVCVATILGLYEFYTMTLPNQRAAAKIEGVALGAILCGVFQWVPYELVIPILGLILFILFMSHPILYSDFFTLPSQIGIIFFGIIYIPFLLSHLILINKVPQGVLWVLLLVATVWAGDTFALIIGSLWGRYKLCPRISPNKTVEGFFSCFVGAVLTVFAFRLLFLPSLTITDSIIIGLGIALFGQLGDLTESMIKRGSKVKDSGTLIPGHGGVLDRLDSFLFASPFLYYILAYKLYPGTI